MKTLGVAKADTPVVQFKTAILTKAMPAESAVVFAICGKLTGSIRKRH